MAVQFAVYENMLTTQSFNKCLFFSYFNGSLPSELLLMTSTANVAAAKNSGSIDIGKRPPILMVSAEINGMSTRSAKSDVQNMLSVVGY